MEKYSVILPPSGKEYFKPKNIDKQCGFHMDTRNLYVLLW